MFSLKKQNGKYNIYVGKKLIGAFFENALEKVLLKYKYSINAAVFCKDLNLSKVFSHKNLLRFMSIKFSDIRDKICRKCFSRNKAELFYGGVTAAYLLIDNEFVFRVSIEKFKSNRRQQGKRSNYKNYMEYVRKIISASIIASARDFESLDDSMLVDLYLRLMVFIVSNKQRFKAATQSIESENDSDSDEAIELLEQAGGEVIDLPKSVSNESRIDSETNKMASNEELHPEAKRIQNEVNTKGILKQTKSNINEFDVKKVDDVYNIYIDGAVFISITENSLLLCFEKFDYSVDMESFINEMNIPGVHSYPNLSKFLYTKFTEIRENLARQYLVKKNIKIEFREIDKVDVADIFIPNEVTFRISIPRFIEGIRQRGGSFNNGNYLQHISNNIASSIILSSSDLMSIDSLTLIGLHILLQSKQLSSPNEFDLDNVSLSWNDQDDVKVEEE